MIEFTVVRAAAEAQARRQAARHPAMRSCQFNDETVFWTSPAGNGSLPRELRRLGGPPQTARGKLHLVVQVGNAFLAHFPWARVAVHKGRYLAVDLTASEVEQIAREPSCFGFCPLDDVQVAFQTR